MILKEQCEKKNCTGILKSTVTIGSQTMKVFECGHFALAVAALPDAKNPPSIEDSRTAPEVAPDVSTYDIRVSETELSRFDDDGNVLHFTSIDRSFESLDSSMTAYPFQQDGVYFAEQTELNCLIADEMGLGKTVQALISLKRNKKRTLICVKGSIMFQWAAQYKRWVNNHPLGIMPVVNRECIIAGFDVYIISIDFLSRKGVLEKLLALGIELLIVDECQNFKDALSKRTVALIKLIQSSKIKHKLFLSGTPIKNRANEYFTILNLLAPKTFQSYSNFCRHWLIPNEKGIYTRLDPMMIEQFRETTSQWIIRREVKDVQKNLPALTHDYQMIEIEDPLMKKSYNTELDLFQNFMRQHEDERINSTVMLGWLAKMRAITGQAKIPYALEYTEQFFEQKESALVLGIHHHAVRDILFTMFKMKGYDPLKFSGEDNSFQKEKIKQAFIRGENRLMIMNIVAGGTGTDGLQHVCHDFVVLERQWSSADEEQFEKRFVRDGQKYPCNAVYPIALGTIDQWFHDLVETKRQIVGETLGDKGFDLMSDESLLKELTNKTLANRL